VSGTATGADDTGDSATGQEEPEFTLADDDYLIRKIPAVPHIVGPTGKRRISKSAFSASSPSVDPEEGMSTNVERLILAGGGSLEGFAPEFPALGRLKVSDAKALGLTVTFAPLDDDPTHCQVLGVKEGHRKKLLKAATFPRKPADVE
jgi:hypothetical protein